MTADREKLREDVARAIYEEHGFSFEGRTVGTSGPYGGWARALLAADAAIALIWPAAMREAATIAERYAFGPAAAKVIRATLLSPDAEKEEGR